MKLGATIRVVLMGLTLAGAAGLAYGVTPDDPRPVATSSAATDRTHLSPQMKKELQREHGGLDVGNPKDLGKLKAMGAVAIRGESNCSQCHKALPGWPPQMPPVPPLVSPADGPEVGLPDQAVNIGAKP
ncbi:MAG: hypothetical protein K0S08_1950 [Gammaproteobacteria bacterium]|jgi:hypothetical protein|nr:hypothetical protein [Gammaproteobacteria bacterium]